jgi:hypothetical protein
VVQAAEIKPQIELNYVLAVRYKQIIFNFMFNKKPFIKYYGKLNKIPQNTGVTN